VTNDSTDELPQFAKPPTPNEYLTAKKLSWKSRQLQQKMNKQVLTARLA
jgi:hypothetical protein